MSEVHFTINGQSVVAEEGQTILEAAQAAQIDIPALCYHPSLSAWGACRMCLVEVEGMRGLHTACTLPVRDDMVVHTKTEDTVEARKFNLELLFSERNHYCMYCQMSGDCELQDLAYEHGLDHFTYPRPYEKLEVDASREYFIMDPNRCILCTRCVRACAEIAANHTLGVRERGIDSRIMADDNVPFGESSCIECGTCIQVCPTGALVDARSAYGGREKDVTHTRTTCMQCSVGCALDVVTRYKRLLRVDGVWDSEPSGGLLCVHGRFEPLYEDRERITTPLVRNGDGLEEASWDEALDLMKEKLSGENAVGLAACATTNEALTGFAKLFDKVGGEAGRFEPLAPDLGYGEQAEISAILESDYIIIAGADPLTYQPVVGYFVKRAADHDVPVALIEESETEMDEYATVRVSYDEADEIVEEALDAENPVVIYSVGLKPEAIEAMKPLASKAGFIGLDPARNGRGAIAAGLNPMEMKDADVLYLLLAEQQVGEAMLSEDNGAFTIVQAAYVSPLVEGADVVLPTPIWSERTGHVTNLEGRVLPLNPALRKPGEVRDEVEVFEDLIEKL